MKQLRQTWEAFYPVIIYLFILAFVAENIAQVVPFMKQSPTLSQGIAKLVCIPAMLYFYRRVPQDHRKMKRPAVNIMRILFISILLSLGLNVLFELIPIKELSPAFIKSASTLYSDKRLIQLLTAGVAAPVLEEILYRGVVYRNLRLAYGKWIAILVSSLLFGALHLNLPQFLFATIMGVCYAYFYEKTGAFYTCIIGHMATNLFGIIASWYGVNRIIMSSTIWEIGVCVVSILCSILLLIRISDK